MTFELPKPGSALLLKASSTSGLVIPVTPDDLKPDPDPTPKYPSNEIQDERQRAAVLDAIHRLSLAIDPGQGRGGITIVSAEEARRKQLQTDTLYVLGRLLLGDYGWEVPGEPKSMQRENQLNTAMETYHRMLTNRRAEYAKENRDDLVSELDYLLKEFTLRFKPDFRPTSPSV